MLLIDFGFGFLKTSLSTQNYLSMEPSASLVLILNYK